MTTPDQTPKQKNEEGMPKKARLALTVLVGALVLVTIAGLIVSSREMTSGDPSSRFSSSLQKLEGGGVTVEFRTVRELPAGAGLNDWLESVPSKARITGVHAEAVSTYFVDAKADWDVSERDGRTVVSIPAPELKSVVLDRSALRINTTGGDLPAEDAQLAREILEEKLPSFLRQDEEPRRPERLEPIRAKVKEFAASTLKTQDFDVIYPGEGGALEDSP